jgi:hypothetical protein
LQNLIYDDLHPAFYDTVWSPELSSVKVGAYIKGISALAIPDCFRFLAEKANGKNHGFRVEISFRGFPDKLGFQGQFDDQVASFCLGEFRVTGKSAG